MRIGMQCGSTSDRPHMPRIVWRDAQQATITARFAAASASGARSPGSLVKIRSPALASRFLAAYSGLTREAYELDLRRDALTDRPRRTERAVMCRHWPRAGPRTQRFLCRLRAAARGWLEREWAVIDHALHHDGGR
jgi:hypothetical protein